MTPAHVKVAAEVLAEQPLDIRLIIKHEMLVLLIWLTMPHARKDNFELSELAGLCLDLDRPSMLLDDDVVTDGEAEAGALAGWLGCEEGIEHLFPDLGRNASAIVTDRDLYSIAEVLCRGPNGRLQAIAVDLAPSHRRGIEAVRD